MPDDLPSPSPDDVASLLRVGLDEEVEALTENEADAAVTLFMVPPSSKLGSNPSRIWQPPSVADLQQMLPQYQVQAFVARGGMGAVYKGVQTTLKRTVAIKVLPLEADDAELQFAERFKREAQAMARLSHPNIVAVHDAGQTASGLLYFVMEFVEGTDVAQLLTREGRLSPERAVPIIMAVCEALAFAHEEGIVHRDIKPSNVIIDPRGRVKVADFGLAKAINVESTLITRSDVAMGTPDFVAPEALIPGIGVDGRADLYAVGVMLYQMLTGQIPRGRFALPSGVIPQVDARFDAIVDKAMQTDRERRYTTAAEMKKEMEKVTTTVAASLPLSSVALDGKKGRSLLLPTLAAVAVLGAAGWLVLGKKQPGAGSAPSSPPASTAGEKTTQIESRASRAAATLEKPGSALFIPGKWTSTSAKQWQALKGRPEFRSNGEMKLGGAVMLADFTAAGVFMRGKVRLPAGSGYTFVHLRESGQGKRTLSIQRLPAKADRWTLQVNDDGTHDDVAPPQSPNFDQMADGEGWIVFEVGAVGKTSFARCGSGQWVKQTDDRLVARGTVTLSGDNATFRDLEILNLDGLPEAEALKLAGISGSTSASPQVSAPSDNALWAALPAAVEARAIRLWDTPEKLPKAKGILWEDQALRLDQASIWYDQNENRDAILRASVLANPDTAAVIALRSLPGQSGQVRLSLDTRKQTLALRTDIADSLLAEWPLPRAYAPTEWLHLELRAIGDVFSVFADGKRVGTTRSTAIQRPGRAILYAGHDGAFREVTYFPLDGLSETEAMKLVDIPTSHDAKSTNPAVVWQDVLREPARLRFAGEASLTPQGLLFTDAGNVTFQQGPSRNGGIRMKAVHGKLRVFPRVRASSSGCYESGVLPSGNEVELRRVTETGLVVSLGKFSLPTPLNDGQEYELDLRIAGDRLAVFFNGTLLGRSVTDKGVAEGGWQLNTVIHDAPPTLVKSLEVLNLDGLPEAEALKLVGVPSSSAMTWSRMDFATFDDKGGAELDVVREGELLHLKNDRMMSAPDVKVRDGAVRAALVYRSPFQTPRLVTRADKGQYHLTLRRSDAIISFYDRIEKPLKTFSLPKPLEEGEEFTAQFASIGTWHYAWFNGTLLGSVEDDTKPESGRLAIQSKDAFFKRMEWLPLDGLPEAEALKLVGAEKAASATGSTRRPEWLDVTEEIRTAGLREGVLKADDKNLSAIQKKGFTLAGGRSFSDVAVRVSFSGSLSIKLRQSDSTAAYSAYVPAGAALTETVSGRMNYNAPRQEVNEALSDWGKAAARGGDDMQEIIFAVQGNKLTLALNGRIVSTATDVRLASGRAELTVMPDDDKGTTTLSKVQIVDLAGLSEAEALKLLGLEPTSAYRLPDGPQGFVKELTGHQGEVMGGKALAILPDSRRVFSVANKDATGADLNEVILWDVETAKPIWTRQLLDTKGILGAAAILPAVNQAVVIHRGPEFVLEFLDLKSGRTVRRATVEKPAAGSFATYLSSAPDGRRFMLVLFPSKTETSEPLLFQLWDASAQSPASRWGMDEKGFLVHAAAWLDDSRYVVNADNPQSDSRFHIILNVNEPGVIRRVAAENEDAQLSFAPVPGRPDQILTHLRSGGLAVYDLSTTAVLRRFSLALVQRQLAFVDAQRVLGLSSDFGDALRLWDTASGRLLWEQKDERLFDGLAVSPDGRWVVTNSSVKNAYGQTRPGSKLLVWRLPEAGAATSSSIRAKAP